jgi:hypothetical protein
MSSPIPAFLKKGPVAFFALDNQKKFIWVSDHFCRLCAYESGEILKMGYEDIVDVYFQSLDINATRIRLNPNRGPERHPYIIDYPSPEEEGIHTQIRAVFAGEDFILYNAFPRTGVISSLQKHFERSLFAVMDEDLNFEEFGNRFYAILHQIFGKRNFRGTSLRSCIIKKDFNEWQGMRERYLDHVNALTVREQHPWRTLFDSAKEDFKSFFKSPPSSWEVNSGSALIEKPAEGLEVDFLMAAPSLDFFHNDFEIEFSMQRGNGGIVLCGTDTPFRTPDENGYLIHLLENKHLFGDKKALLLKRNANDVSIHLLDKFPDRFRVRKMGPVISVFCDGKSCIRYFDEIPFYSDYRELNRFGLKASSQERFTMLKISTRPSLYDYEKLK